MPKMERPLWLDCIVFIQLMHLCFACQMEGVTNWRLRVEERIFDTHNGVVLDRNTSDILGINSIVHSEGLNRGPYIDVKYENSRFIVATRANFAEYEEYETSKTMRVTVSFNCAQGSTNQPPLVIQIDIIDTNQNAPRFLPSDNYEFTVIPPLPPGFLVTGCDNQIIARDIDLTTQRVDFTIEENDYFEIFYDSSPASKEFSATLRAKMFIRSIPDDLSLKIMATDVDETSDPPLTTEGTVRIISDTQFQLPEELQFSKLFYLLNYTNENLVTDELIFLNRGYDDRVTFSFEGDHKEYFEMTPNGNRIAFRVKTEIPTEILREQQIYLIVRAEREHTSGAAATIIIQLPTDPITDVKFDKVLYLGRVENNAVVHEVITVVEFSGNVQVSGEYSHLFRAAITNGVVTITLSATSVPSTLSYVALKLIADEANAVLLLDIYESDTPVDPPSLSFSSSSYILEANEGSTGEVGRVSAIASNGENVIYSLEIENEHLKQRLTVNNNGEIHLSASANLGVYSFKATARTRISQVSASAAVQLTIAELGTTFNLPPLLVLERDEEEPHLNLVPLDRTKYPNCEYSLSNKWPLDQNWLYVNSQGLHTRSIDREHDSIAFMPVSQIQVELNLNCNKRSKRSNVDTLDYGSNKWILTDSISYNPSRTLVNLIVRDINDNAPKFEADSVTVGYPSGDLAEIVLPRALAELKATDADIEENALLRYMSSDERFVVSPTSGSVHLRNRVTLEDNTRLVVYAVDRNGTGLKGSVEIMVRLLDRSKIAVVTVPSRFLDDESTILDELTNAVGYDVKPLRTTVISESRYDNEGDKSRERRDVNTNGASLRLYVYGLKQREPVDVTQLTDDLRNTMVTVSLARVLSLEDHLDELQICPAFEREIGLLAATIVLAVLLLIIILVFGVWFYLRRKIANDYDQFSDRNSLRSRNDSVESPKVEPVFTTPRLIGIEELRKSEKKLQERLDAPKEVPEKASSKNIEKTEAIINVSETDSKWPIVIQSIDKLKDNTDESDDDEFGEKVRPRRKSVVTFNENVEKIIHLEDVSVDDNSEADVEVHKL